MNHLLVIRQFEKDLKNKITLKMIPNQTEDQILCKYFKYFDLENSGFCNFRDFIKTVEKIGVVLCKIQDIERVFKYYDTEETGFIDYRKFCQAIYTTQDTNNNNNPNNSINVINGTGNKTETYFENLHMFLLKNRGAKALVSLFKDFKMVDYNRLNRVMLDDFLKIISERKIGLGIHDIQFLFHRYELYSNGLFFYEEMFKDLKNIYHNERREKFIVSFYNTLTKMSSVGLADLKQMFNPRNHPKCLDGSLSEKEVTEEFNFLVDSMQLILKLYKSGKELSQHEFAEFFKFFGFGIEDDKIFFQLISQVFDFTHIGNAGSDTNSNDPLYKNNIKATLPTTEPAAPVFEKFQNNLKQLGRKSFFALIKHFKYYDNGTQFITKFDFAKVLKDLRLNMTITEIEKLFESYCTDKKKVLVNIEKFVFLLCRQNFNEDRKLQVGKVYSAIQEFSGKLDRHVDLDMIKSLYNGKSHLLGKDEGNAISEFCDCIDLFHFSFKMKRLLEVPYEEFEEFYRLISFLVDDDEAFEKILTSEWKSVLPDEKPRQKKEIDTDKIIESNPRPRTPISRDDNNARPITPFAKKINQNEEQANVQSNYLRTPIKTQSKIIYDPIAKLKDKLLKRGMRGLMNLHKQFLLTCPNLNYLTFADFFQTLKLQRLDMNKEDYQSIFDQFKSSTSNNTESLNFKMFIRNFKKILQDKRLQVVENAFASLDIERNNMIFLDDIKLKYNSLNHPDTTKNLRSEDAVVTEFLDCIELNCNLLCASEKNNDSSKLISFEEFANFYEYVSFLYDNENDFVNLVSLTWNLT